MLLCSLILILIYWNLKYGYPAIKKKTKQKRNIELNFILIPTKLINNCDNPPLNLLRLLVLVCSICCPHRSRVLFAIRMMLWSLLVAFWNIYTKNIPIRKRNGENTKLHEIFTRFSSLSLFFFASCKHAVYYRER